MRVRIDTFLGEIPRRDPKMLPQGGATKAEDVDLASGALRSMRGSVTATTLVDLTTHFIAYDGTFLTQSARTTFAPGPVADDRLYIATEGKAPRLRKMGSGAEYTLALPTPTAPPSISIHTAAPAPAEGEDPNPVETRVYVTTWVSDLNEETPPSPLSNPLDVEEGATVHVNITDHTPPTGTRINRIRVYCSQTSATGATGLYFIKELSAGTTEYVHDFAVDPLQEVLPSADYDPPVATLKGITPLWNGMIAAFSGRSLYFCEPFIPHAWPIKYELKTDYPIVGLAANGTFLAVLTTGTPYIVGGSAPENMLLERIDQNMPCIAPEGIADIGTGVLFPSHEGLVMMQNGGMKVISRELFDRRAWRALKPATIRAAHFDGRYIFSHELPDATRRTVIVDMNGETPGLVRSSQTFSSAAFDLVAGKLYLSDGSATIREFAAETGANLPLEWDSGIVHLPTDAHFGVIRVDGKVLSGTPSVSVYADGVLNATITEFNTVQRLAPGWADEWQVRVTGAAEITRITMAGAPDELMAG